MKFCSKITKDKRQENIRIFTFDNIFECLHCKLIHSYFGALETIVTTEVFTKAVAQS